MIDIAALAREGYLNLDALCRHAEWQRVEPIDTYHATPRGHRTRQTVTLVLCRDVIHDVEVWRWTAVDDDGVAIGTDGDPMLSADDVVADARAQAALMDDGQPRPPDLPRVPNLHALISDDCIDAAARVAAYLASRLDPEREEDPVKHSRRTDDADRRAALAALSVPCTRHQLASRLRWTQRRADDVLADLARAGLVVCQRMRQSTTGPLEDVWRVCAPADA